MALDALSPLKFGEKTATVSDSDTVKYREIFCGKKLFADNVVWAVR
jgi:hypothetical protein